MPMTAYNVFNFLGPLKCLIQFKIRNGESGVDKDIAINCDVLEFYSPIIYSQFLLSHSICVSLTAQLVLKNRKRLLAVYFCHTLRYVPVSLITFMTSLTSLGVVLNICCNDNRKCFAHMHDSV